MGLFTMKKIFLGAFVLIFTNQIFGSGIMPCEKPLVPSWATFLVRSEIDNYFIKNNHKDLITKYAIQSEHFIKLGLVHFFAGHKLTNENAYYNATYFLATHVQAQTRLAAPGIKRYLNIRVDDRLVGMLCLDDLETIARS